MPDLGRQVKYGIGVGSANPAYWFNQLSFSTNPVVTSQNNSSSWGNIVRTNNTTVIRRHAEGELEAKLTPNLGGLVLFGALGSVSSAPHADASGTVYNHTMTINQDILGQSFNLVRQDSLSTESFLGTRIGEWSLQVDLDDYIRYTANIMAKEGVTTTATAAMSEEAEFVAKHFTVKTATSTAGLAGATSQATVESFSLTVNPNIEADNFFGPGSPASFSSRGYELSFEMTRRYVDRVYENAYKNATDLAMQLVLENTDVTIGTSAKPKFQFTFGRFNITDWTKNEDLDAPVTETLTGTIHFNPTDSRAIQAIVTNTTPSYI